MPVGGTYGFKDGMTSIRVEARQVTRPWKATLEWFNARSDRRMWAVWDDGPRRIVGVSGSKIGFAIAREGDWLVRLPNRQWLVLSDEEWKQWKAET